MLKEIVKNYFFDLGNELSELGSNICNKITTKKWLIILSSIVLFILGCFIWKPLFPITIVGFMMLMISLCIMIIPITSAVLVFILFHLECLGNEYVKYPVLQFTLATICSILTLCGTSYLTWDIALRDMWINPEMWRELISMNL